MRPRNGADGDAQEGESPSSEPASWSSGPEVMSAGPALSPVRTRRFLLRALVLAAVVAVLIGGVVGWRAYRQATDPISAAELQRSYDAVISLGGTASTTPLSRARSAALHADEPTTTPQRCAAVTDSTVQDQFPDTAVDGLTSYPGGSMDFATGLLSFRFATADAAKAEFARVERAAADCDGAELSITEPWNAHLRLQRQRAVVPGSQACLDVLMQPVSQPTRSAGQVVYRPSYELTLARYKNVISWQYSYRSGPGQPNPDHQLLDTLSQRLVDIDHGRNPDDADKAGG